MLIDVSNPAHARLVRYLQDKGAHFATETLHAVTSRGRSILAARTSGSVIGMSAPKEGPLSIYDVTDCADPKLLSQVNWPLPVHTLRISPSGRYVYGPVRGECQPACWIVCAFPEMARYKGTGDVNNAANWTCDSSDKRLLTVGEDGRREGVIQ